MKRHRKPVFAPIVSIPRVACKHVTFLAPNTGANPLLHEHEANHRLCLPSAQRRRGLPSAEFTTVTTFLVVSIG
jgi:hypothetical protein